MKCFLLSMLLFVLSDFIQAQDSTQIKLEQYKKWHESGLIGDDEYLKAKNQLLGLPVSSPAVKSEVKSNVKALPQATLTAQELAELKWKNKYTGKLAGGSVMMVLGGGMFFSAIAMIPINADRPLTNKIPGGAIYGLMGIGALSMCAGGILIGSGLKDKRSKPPVALLIADRIGVCYNF